MKNKIMICLLTAYALYASSCKKSVYETPVLPDTISFSKHIIPIFNQNCNNAGCHSGVQPQGNLDLSPSMAYQNLISKSLVDTLNPANSLLYAQMNSQTKPMPPSGKLDTLYLNEVLKWIEQGAKDN
jgi:hypothetical protein